VDLGTEGLVGEEVTRLVRRQPGQAPGQELDGTFGLPAFPVSTRRFVSMDVGGRDPDAEHEGRNGEEAWAPRFGRQ
jgi:hypothetical protein